MNFYETKQCAVHVMYLIFINTDDVIIAAGRGLLLLLLVGGTFLLLLLLLCLHLQLLLSIRILLIAVDRCCVLFLNVFFLQNNYDNTLYHLCKWKLKQNKKSGAV